MSKNINSQKKKAKLSYFIPCKDTIEAEFGFSDVGIKTIRIENTWGFRIDIEVEIEQFDSLNEGSRYGRPLLLITLGVISFMTKEHFSTRSIQSMNSNSISKSVLEHDVKKQKTVLFKQKNIDLSVPTKRLIQKIELEIHEKKTLLFSLLDRWRKAQFLKNGGVKLLSNDEGAETLFNDEAFLAYFHVLELLTHEYKKQQEEEASEKCDLFVKNLLENTYKYRGKVLEQKKEEKIKLIKKIILNDEILSLKQKIKYMLFKMEMLDERSSFFVDNLVDIRNSIAHGKLEYRSKMIWPLTAFFPINRQNLVEELIDQIEVIAARVIARHYDLELWEQDWNDLHSILLPPWDIICDFVRNRKYETISTKSFIEGETDFVTPFAVLSAFLEGKLKEQKDFEQSLKRVIMEIEPNENNADWLLISSVILADSSNEEISEKSSELVNEIVRKKIHNFSNIRDLYYLLVDFYQKEVKWLNDWLLNRKTYSSSKYR